MKQAFILLQLLLSIPLAWADGGGFARAAEFGFPKLDMTRDLNALKAHERVWSIEGEKPFRALLLGFEGEWGKEAVLLLRTPTGRELKVPALAAGDADIQSVRDWIADNGFVTLRPIAKPPILAKIISVTRPKDSGSMGEYNDSDVVFMTLPNGTNTEWRVNRQHVNENYAKKISHNNITWVNDETRAMLDRIRNAQQEDDRAPLPIAENADEAIAWSAATGKSVVMVLLNRRGSLHDAAFRQYLAKYPYATGLWGKRHVFLLAYADDEGVYPAECIRASVLMKALHPFFGLKELDPLNSLGFFNRHTFEQSFCIDILVFCHPDSMPRLGSARQTHNHFNIEISDFLSLPPESFSFGLY